MNRNGLAVIRLKDVELVDRMNVDNWPVRIGLYYTDPVYGVKVRMIDYENRAIEPRHVHPGKHGTTIARGRVLTEAGTLGPLDVILGPSNEPHGPFEYPDGCNLISFFRGATSTTRRRPPRRASSIDSSRTRRSPGRKPARARSSGSSSKASTAWSSKPTAFPPARS
jgi:hypothetical protein